MNRFFLILWMIGALALAACNKEGKTDNGTRVLYDSSQFFMGADLSYVNQILDHNGIYKDSGKIRNPYSIFRENGTNLVRVRLWHNPVWTKEVYGVTGTQLYSDLKDAAKSIAMARQHKMYTILDLHYSDTWADPGKQIPPAAWKDIKDIQVLKDSVYNYTYHVLQYLRTNHLLPDMIQIGNEINCGMLSTHLPADFPNVNVCDDHWAEQGLLINEGIRAVRNISSESNTMIQVVLHVADPKNLEWWFDHITKSGNVYDFDIIGFSYYPLWHTEISYDQLPALVESIRQKYSKKMMILETGYPWTTEGKDNYNNMLGSQPQTNGFSYTQQGQKEFLIDLTQKMIHAGAIGLIYWEPAWISSDMKDLWGSGSSWENSTFFDFDGNSLPSFDFMTYLYKFD